jgi:hypothetical protein
MPTSSLNISHSLNSLTLSNDELTTVVSNPSYISTTNNTDISNFTIAANNDYNTSLGYFFNQMICLFDSLYFEQRESNILIINYEKALIWDENVNKFKLINIKKFDYELIEADEKYDSINSNLTFNSNFTNASQIFLNLLLEQNDLVFIDTEKNKNYKFCSKNKNWILLDSKSFFNIEFENDIKIFDIKNQNNHKKILIEKKSKLNFLNTGFVYAPYIPLDGTVTITENIYNNNRIYNSDLLSRYYNVGVDVSNYYTTGTTMVYGTLEHP